MPNERAVDLVARLGTGFEVRALHVGERIEIRGIEPRLSPQLPVMIEVARRAMRCYAVLCGATARRGGGAVRDR
jgi:hypothetical protein